MMSPRAEPAPGGRFILAIVSHPSEGRKLLVEPGKAARVGRTDLSELVVGDDESMSGVHFSITWDGVTCSLRDMNSATGTLLNGARVERGVVAHGDWIRAGNTDFCAYREGFTQRRGRASSAERDAALRLLQEHGKDLYAILDAARSPRVLELLQESADDSRSLYEGLGGATFARVAPYLVKLAVGSSPLLESLVYEGWSESWGVFLTSARPLRELRRHLRRFLVVDDPAGASMVFRFYDPRVLRAFLPTLTPRQREELWSDVGRFIIEGKGGREAHLFEARPGKALDHRTVKLTGARSEG